MNKPLTVFLCSTQADLKPEREAVLAAVRRLQLQHDSMEFFGAREGEPLETCLNEVRRSDVLVVIIGHRYGTFVPGSEISYSESEYREGHRLGKPCLVYLRDENVPVLPRHMERDPAGIKALDRFKKLLQERHTVAYFRALEDLAVGVAADLSRTAQAIEETARLEAEQATSKRGSLIERLAEIAKDGQIGGIADEALVSEFRQALNKLLSPHDDKQPTVFLSHTSKDRKVVRAFADSLRSKGFNVWLDEEQIAVGQSLFETISRGIQTADCLALFLSSESLQSQWVQQEISIVMASRLTGRRKSQLVIPIVLDDVDLPPLIRDVKYVDMKDGDAERAAGVFAQAYHRHIEPPATQHDRVKNEHSLEKAIHALRALLHARKEHPENLSPGTGRASLECAIEDLAKAVGGLCGLSTNPVNRLQDFVNRVLKARGGNDLPRIFRELPELRQYLEIPNFDSGDING